MEYVDGTTLQEVSGGAQARSIWTRRARSPPSFWPVLEAIHDAGLVHRDIKPENLMITRTGRVVVMDFGIAKGLARRRKGGVIAGNPRIHVPGAGAGRRSWMPVAISSQPGSSWLEMVEPGGWAPSRTADGCGRASTRRRPRVLRDTVVESHRPGRCTGGRGALCDGAPLLSSPVPWRR